MQPIRMKNLHLDNILKRIAEIEGIRFTDTELGKVLGKQRSTVSSWRKRGSIPFADIFEYCERQKISLDSVFLGTKSTSLPIEAVQAIVSAVNGHDLNHDKLRKVIELISAKWPMSAEELKLIVELAI